LPTIGHAYERDDGTMVMLEDRDFEAARTEGYHAITVLDFVPYDDIDPIYFERTFFLGPQDDGAAAHTGALLARAMDDAGLSAVCSYNFHNREQLGCLRVRDGVLHLEKMYFADEVRKKYRDTYGEALLKVIAKKAKGKRITVPEPKKSDKAPDLMAALEASLKAGKRRTRSKKAARK
jgi:DNA end-binding protein Ku